MAGVLGSPQTPDVGQELSLGIMTALPPFFLFFSFVFYGLFLLVSAIYQLNANSSAFEGDV